jgi:hypothetical protein
MLKTCSNHEFLWSQEGERVDLWLGSNLSQELSQISPGSKIWCRRKERDSLGCSWILLEQDVNIWTLDPWDSFPPNGLDYLGLGEEERAQKNGEISDPKALPRWGKRVPYIVPPPNRPVMHRKTQPGTSVHAQNFRAHFSLHMCKLSR